MRITYNYAIVQDQQTLWVRSVFATPADTLETAWKIFSDRFPSGNLRLVKETVPKYGVCSEVTIKERKECRLCDQSFSATFDTVCDDCHTTP